MKVVGLRAAASRSAISWVRTLRYTGPQMGWPSSAEDGHPIWGPVYRNVRTQLIAEREAAARKPTTFMPLAKAEQLLADGTVKYDAGDYAAAHKLFEDALREGLKD